MLNGLKRVTWRAWAGIADGKNVAATVMEMGTASVTRRAVILDGFHTPGSPRKGHNGPRLNKNTIGALDEI